MHQGTVYFTKEQTSERARTKKATEAHLRIVREPALHYVNTSSQHGAALSVYQILLSADGSPPEIFCEIPEECTDKRSMEEIRSGRGDPAGTRSRRTALAARILQVVARPEMS